VSLSVAVSLASAALLAQTTLGTAFTYQGALSDAGRPANGLYDFQFGLFDAASAGAQIGVTITKSGVSVVNGIISTTLDFGSVFTGSDRLLEIAVRPGGSAGTYTTMTPRQPLTASPYALYTLTARDAERLGGLAASAYSRTGDAVAASSLAGIVGVANGGTGAGNGTEALALLGGQVRVTGTCSPGSTIRAIADNGSVTCEAAPTALGNLSVAASDPPSPVTGTVYYNSTTQSVRYYNGSAWNSVVRNGDAFSGNVTVASSARACDPAQAGALRFTGGSNPLELCTGSAWSVVPLSPAYAFRTGTAFGSACSSSLGTFIDTNFDVPPPSSTTGRPVLVSLYLSDTGMGIAGTTIFRLTDGLGNEQATARNSYASGERKSVSLTFLLSGFPTAGLKLQCASDQSGSGTLTGSTMRLYMVEQ